jgi:hypothetical protein
VTPPLPLGSYRLTVCNQFIAPTSPIPLLCNGQDLPTPIKVDPVPPPANLVAFAASPSSLQKEGGQVTLSWSFQNAITVTLQSSDPKETLPSVTAKDTSGNAPVTPSMPVTYTLTIEGADGVPHSAPARVAINPPQLTFNQPASQSVLVGAPVHLTWQAQGFTSLTLEARSADANQPVDVVSGQPKVPLTDQSNAFDAVPTGPGVIEYVLTATNGAGSVVKTQRATVAKPTFEFTASPATITPGQPVTLKWTAPGAKAIKIDPLGPQAPDASPLTVNPTATTTYVFTATGPDGTVSAPITQTVKVGLGAPKIDFITPAPATINKGDKTTLTFSAENAKHVTLKRNDGKTLLDRDVSTPSYQGSVTDSPPDVGTFTYTLIVTNDSGQPPSVSPATLTVAAPTPTPAPSPAGGGSTTPSKP